MATLADKFQLNLPMGALVQADTSSEWKVSVLHTNKKLYAACCTTVYLVDPIYGKVIHDQVLDVKTGGESQGGFEVQIAAPADGSYIVAGCNGYVEQLNSSDLSINWGPISLPGC